MSQFFRSCPPSSLDVILSYLTIAVAFCSDRQLLERPTFGGQRCPHVMGRTPVHARCALRRCPLRGRRRPLAGEVGGVAVAEVAAATPLAHGLAVGGQLKVRVVRVNFVGSTDHPRTAVNNEQHHQRDETEPSHRDSAPATTPPSYSIDLRLSILSIETYRSGSVGRFLEGSKPAPQRRGSRATRTFITTGTVR